MKKSATSEDQLRNTPGWLPPFVELLFPKTEDAHEPLIDDLLIRHRNYDLIMEALEDLDDIDRAVLGEHGLLMTGESRLGKTRLLAEYIAVRMPYRTPNGLVIPVLYIEVPESPTIKIMAVTLLREFGETPGGRDNAEDLLQRIVVLARNTGVRVICLDDLHHFVDQHGLIVQYELTEWLKRLVIQMRVAVVICGLDRTQSAIRLNEQLYGRMDAKLRLRRFDWRRNADRKQFTEIIEGVHASLGNEFRLPTCDANWIFSWYMACAGRLGFVIKIARRAIKLARKRKTCVMDKSLFHAAWLKSVFDAASVPEIQRPFGPRFSVEWNDKIIQEVLQTGVEMPVESPDRNRIRRNSARARKVAVRAAMEA
ncbi:TniB family NTP-binding protein [Rhodanobacter koreensis]